MFDTRTKRFFFACLKDAAGAAIKSAAPAPGSGSATLVADNEAGHIYDKFSICGIPRREYLQCL